MGALLQYDDGPTLLVTCDVCSEQMMAFGTPIHVRSDLESRIVIDGWTFNGDVAWLCVKCGGGSPGSAIPKHIASVSLLKMPE